MEANCFPEVMWGEMTSKHQWDVLMRDMDEVAAERAEDMVL